MGAGATRYASEREARDAGYSQEQISEYMLRRNQNGDQLAPAELARDLRRKETDVREEIRRLLIKKESLRREKRQIEDESLLRREESRQLMQVVIGLKESKRATMEKSTSLRRVREQSGSISQLENLRHFLINRASADDPPRDDESEGKGSVRDSLLENLSELNDEYESVLPRRIQAWADNSELKKTIESQKHTHRALARKRDQLVKKRRQEKRQDAFFLEERSSAPAPASESPKNSVTPTEYLSFTKAGKIFPLCDQIVSPLKSPDYHAEDAEEVAKEIIQNGISHDGEQSISVGDNGRDAFHGGLGGVIFRRGKFLGAGAFGSVYLVFTEDGTPMAMKQMRLPSSSEGHVREDVLKEVKLMESLDHKNVVRYICCDVDVESVRVFMEYLPLGSIKSIIKESSPLKERAARNYIRQAVRGLEYLHNMYVTHCDIKCDNLLVSANGIIKVADFGCSFRFESESFQFNENSVSEDRAIRGSVPWLAPEVIHGARHRPTSDIWAIGIVLIEMLTGTHPWRNQKNVLSLAWHIADVRSKKDAFCFIHRQAGHI